MSESWFHTPVLLDELKEACLRSDLCHSPGIWLDGTVGLGGHSEGVGLNLPIREMWLNDADEQALAFVRDRFSQYQSSFSLVYFNEFLDDCFVSLSRQSVRWCLLDLGLSSYQLDTPERGFSFFHDGPLDMRFSQKGDVTAWTLLQESSWSDLVFFFEHYGEEPRAKQLAKAIVMARRQNRLPSTTRAFASWVASVLKYRKSRRHPATRTFQALRIAVNDELGRLERVLETVRGVLEEKALLAILTFHSLEQKRVEGSLGLWEKEKKGCFEKKFPSGKEVEQNPRSRSACLNLFFHGLD